MNAENAELQHLAKKACTSYLKSVNLMEAKNVFDVHSIDLQKLASAHGLLNAPTIEFVKSEGPILSKEDRIKARVKILK